jgi:hypothetical protein
VYIIQFSEKRGIKEFIFIPHSSLKRELRDSGFARI